MKKILLISTIFLLGLTSCNQDLLDIRQKGVSSMDSFYAEASDDDALALIGAIYRNSFNYNNGQFLAMMGEMADEVLSWPQNWAVRLHSYTPSLNATNHPMNNWYRNYYQCNYQCNMIIENMAEDSAAKTRVVGEAYFFRAWAMLNLIRGWGTPPLVDHVLSPSELQPENGDSAALWNYVTTSLEEAIKRLPSKSGLGKQFSDIGGRVSKQAAQCLMGKAYLLAGDKDKAASVLKEVIKSGVYALQEDFATLWRPAADFCDEYIWEANVSDANEANFELEGASDKRMHMSWASEMTMPGTLWRLGKAQWGYAQGPSLSTVNFMYDRGEYGKERWMCSIWDYSQLLQKWQELEGDDIATADATSGLMWLQKGSPVVGNQGFFRSKFYWYKEDIFPNPPRANRQYSKANWPQMRYAEVLLLYAEAVVGGDSDGLGLKGLNAIRKRAGLEPLSSFTLQDVKDERRAELFCEGERFYDLVRWGDAPDFIKGQYTVSPSFYGYVEGTDPTITGKEAWSKYHIVYQPVTDRQDFVKGKHEYFPFPYTEIIQNPNLKQNPGWD